MPENLGMVRPGSTIQFLFSTHDGGTGATVAIDAGNALAAADVKIYKDGGATARASTSGFTVTEEFGTTTGINLVQIDLADNTTANFYEAGSFYVVTVDDISVDSQTVEFVLGSFTIGYPSAILNTTIATLSTQTSFTLEDGSLLADAYNGCVIVAHQLDSAVDICIGYISDYAVTTKTVTLAADPVGHTMAAGDNISLFVPSNVNAWNNVDLATTNPLPNAAPDSSGGLATEDASGHLAVDVREWLGTAVTTSATTNKPQVDVDSIDDDAGAADNAESFFDGTGYAGTGNTIPTVTTLTGHTAQTGDSFARLGAPAGASVSADILELRNSQVLASGTSDSGTTTTMVDAARTESDDDYWKGDYIVFTSGNIDGQVRLITGFTAASDTITFAPATTQAVATQTYEIIPAARVDLQLWLGSVANALVSGAVDADVSAIQAGAITAAAIATDAVDADALATDAVNEIVDQVWDEAQADHVAAGSFGVTASEIANIEADTNELQTDWVDGGRLDLIIDELTTNVDAVETDTQDIQNRLPAALVSGKMDSDVTAISGDTTAADRLEALMDGGIVAQVNDASATTTAFAADGFTEATDDHFNGRLITFISGALAGQQTAITDYDAAGHAQGSQAFVVDALTEAPANDVFFVIH